MNYDSEYTKWIIGGRYEVLSKLGEGTSSVVYKAHCNRLNRYVAIKILKEEFFADKSLRKQFHCRGTNSAGSAGDHNG